MATTADFKNGLCINFNGDVWQIVEFQHVKPGKGNAFVRTRLKNLKNGKVLANTFPAGVKIDTARVERRPYQFLYKDENGYNFMNTNAMKDATIDTGATIRVPLFVNTGDKVRVDTRNGEYSQRV